MLFNEIGQPFLEFFLPVERGNAKGTRKVIEFFMMIGLLFARLAEAIVCLKKHGAKFRQTCNRFPNNGSAGTYFSVNS